MNTLYENAMSKLKTDKNNFTINETFEIANFFNEYIIKYHKAIPEGITTQINKDISIYKKYDAIAMWVGDGGLIEYEPEFITGLVKLFDIEE